MISPTFNIPKSHTVEEGIWENALIILRTPHTIVPSHKHCTTTNELEHVSTPTVNTQTVMTSVYGVTKVGARAQIHARLAEKLLTDATVLSTIEMDKALFGASTLVTTWCYTVCGIVEWGLNWDGCKRRDKHHLVLTQPVIPLTIGVPKIITGPTLSLCTTTCLPLLPIPFPLFSTPLLPPPLFFSLFSFSLLSSDISRIWP